MDYEKLKERAQKHAERVQKLAELREIWHSSDPKKKKLEFSKIALIFVFIDCLIIQFYSMWLMATLQDASSLSSLIGIIMPIAGEVGSVISYNKKSSVENSANGIVYESYMASIRSANELTEKELDEAVG